MVVADLRVSAEVQRAVQLHDIRITVWLLKTISRTVTTNHYVLGHGRSWVEDYLAVFKRGYASSDGAALFVTAEKRLKSEEYDLRRQPVESRSEYGTRGFIEQHEIDRFERSLFGQMLNGFLEHNLRTLVHWKSGNARPNRGKCNGLQLPLQRQPQRVCRRCLQRFGRRRAAAKAHARRMDHIARFQIPRSGDRRESNRYAAHLVAFLLNRLAALARNGARDAGPQQQIVVRRIDDCIDGHVSDVALLDYNPFSDRFSRFHARRVSQDSSSCKCNHHGSSTHKNLVTVRNDSLFACFQRNLPSEPRQRIVRLDCFSELHGLSTVRLRFDVAAQGLAHVHTYFLRLVVFQFQLAFHRHEVELISVPALHVLLPRHFPLFVAGADILRNRYSQTVLCFLRREGQLSLRNRLGAGNHYRRFARPW